MNATKAHRVCVNVAQATRAKICSYVEVAATEMHSADEKMNVFKSTFCALQKISFAELRVNMTCKIFSKLIFCFAMNVLPYDCLHDKCLCC